MMSFTRKDSRAGLHQLPTSPGNPTWPKASGHRRFPPAGPAGYRAPETPRTYYYVAAAADNDAPAYSPSSSRPTHDEAYKTQDARRLPSLNELFASKILIAPGTGTSPHHQNPAPASAPAPECTGLPPLREPSISSSGHGSPLSGSTTYSNPESFSDSDSEARRRSLTIRSACAAAGPGSGRHYSPSSSAAAFGKDGNFQPIRTDSIVGLGVDAAACDSSSFPSLSSSSSSSSTSAYNSVWPSTAALYADPEFKPSGAGFTAEYRGIKSVPGFGNYHVYEGGFCIPTHIDGEAVNPVWGLTKSKNPRKRLPIACGWCRRKKIRCEPSSEGCLQCKKAKRQCEMEPVRRPSIDDSSFTECIVT